MRIRHLLSIVFLMLSLMISAQKADILEDLSTPSFSGGAVIMPQDSLLSHLIQLQQEVSKQDGKSVYRVQLYRGNNMQASRQEAAAVKTMFLEKYPNQEVFTPFDAPYWKVRVGTFDTYNEALKLRTKLEKELSSIKEDIYIISTSIHN